MPEIIIAQEKDLIYIHTIAEKTWPVAYADVITAAQIRYMLDKMHTVSALKSQVEKGHIFLVAFENKLAAGFASFEKNFDGENNTKLHKLYVLPQMQGKNIGKALLKEVILAAKKANQKSIVLQVNRKNKALNFYLKNTFKLARTEDFDIGNGFFMNDYIMELRLT
jgi:GNAT superfamily N-acetyltransferase